MPKNAETKNKELCVKCNKRRVIMYPIPTKNEKGEITENKAYICDSCLKVLSFDTVIKQLDGGFNELFRAIEEMKAILTQILERLSAPKPTFTPVKVVDANFTEEYSTVAPPPIITPPTTAGAPVEAKPAGG